MNILVLNSGSSSLKYKLIEMTTRRVVSKGICEKIGEEESLIKQTNFNGKQLQKTVANVKNHKDAFRCIEQTLTDSEFGVIKCFEKEISAVGHRIVHGGEHFKEPALITNEVISEIKSLIPLAPLHNPSHLSGILACAELLGKKIPQVAVFDTSFYSDLAPKAYMFPVPYKYYEKYHIRKYGFHGTSHKYVSNRHLDLTKNPKAKIISCHLGNGSSITAIDSGKAIETSMGLTPLGGIMMGTRSGSIDPSVILQIAQYENLNVDEINNLLNKKSGLLGISEVGSDDREILAAEKQGNPKAKLAHEMMVYQISQFIGAYNVVLQGCDSIIFTGGIGENQWIHRKNICKNLEFMGVEIDDSLNKSAVSGKETEISSKNSKIKVWVIPTNEEMEIALETMDLLFNNQKSK